MTNRYFRVIGKIPISFGVRQFTYFSGGKIGKIGILEYDKAVYVCVYVCFGRGGGVRGS